MAPKGGKGGSYSSGGSGGSSNSCPEFSILVNYKRDGIYPYLAYYIDYILFFLLTVIVLLSLFCVRRKKTRLTGPLFIVMLLFGIL